MSNCSAPTQPSGNLRRLFEEMSQVCQHELIAKIDALGLEAPMRERLFCMLMFDKLVDAANRTAQSATTPHPALRQSIVTDAHIPNVLASNAATVFDMLDAGYDSLARSMIGTSIGEFELTHWIGEGGTSHVFRAERQQHGVRQEVAIKLLRTGLFSQTARKRFMREQTILAMLHHRNIARLVHAGISSAGIPYIAMELISGMPITAAAEARSLNLCERLKWFASLCDTVESTHQAGIVHRDLKPSNLFVTDADELKILDFGIARLIADGNASDSSRAIYLTPGYAAPEQFERSPLTAAMDVYALGVVLGELLTGQRLDGKQRASRFVRSTKNLSIPSGVGTRSSLQTMLRGDIDRILLKALKRDPSLRYSNAGLLARDVRHYLESPSGRKDATR